MLRPALAALAAVLLPACAHAATLAGGSSPQIPWVRLIVSLVFCLGLALSAILVMRRMQQQGTGGILRRMRGERPAAPDTFRILEARRISPTSHLCLVEFDGREFLLAATDHAVEVVAERAAATAKDLPGASA